MIRKISIGIVFAIICIFNANSVQATVGGPTYIYDIRAGGDVGEIVYVKKNLGGSGCPPEIYKISTETNKASSLVGCYDGIDPADYDAKFNSVLNGYPTLLNRINLESNSIEAVVKVIREVEVDEEKEIYFPQTDFGLDVYQNGIQKTTLTYTGCTTDQPHVIEGYAVPNSNLIALLVSTKGDCFEGGYITERLYVVPNITVNDSTALPLREKNTPAIANAVGNLTISLGNPGEVTPPIQPKPNSSIPTYYIYIIVGALALAILIVVLRLRKNS
jgi:hypothetical protein